MSTQPEALSLADWLDAVGNGGISTTAAAAELRRLHAENEALRRDAARYRWLRECDGGEIYALLGDYDGIRGAAMDAEIDAALAQEDRND